MLAWLRKFAEVKIPEMLRREVHRTELSLLSAEDELLNAQHRVRTLKARLAKLKADPRTSTYEAPKVPKVRNTFTVTGTGKLGDVAPKDGWHYSP